MGKFVLVLHVCSYLTMQCPGSAIMGIQYDNWADCSMDGYRFSARHLAKMDQNRVNKEKLAIRFECRQVGAPT